MKDSFDLGAVASVVLALGLSGCCGDVPDDVSPWSYEEAVEGPELEAIRMENSSDEDRCSAACREVASSVDEVDLETVDRCSAVGDVEEGNPWSESNTRVTISCEGTTTSPGFCSGRRPLGHNESTRPVRGVGSWLAAHAHLEEASVTAFSQLADWLEACGAPGHFVERCRAAAQDEVEHASVVGGLARQFGAELEPVRTEVVGNQSLLEVALHNAVEGCVYESFASMLAAVQAQRGQTAQLRGVFARIADDELRHGQLAWDLHAWFLEQLDADGRRRVAEAQRQAFARLESSARLGAEATPELVGWPSANAAAEMAVAFARCAQANAHVCQMTA
jgi:hypothetical protein